MSLIGSPKKRGKRHQKATQQQCCNQKKEQKQNKKMFVNVSLHDSLPDDWVFLWLTVSSFALCLLLVQVLHDKTILLKRDYRNVFNGWNILDRCWRQRDYVRHLLRLHLPTEYAISEECIASYQYHWFMNGLVLLVWSSWCPTRKRNAANR